MKKIKVMLSIATIVFITIIGSTIFIFCSNYNYRYAVFGSIFGTTNRSSIARQKSSMKTIDSALTEYYATHNCYPERLDVFHPSVVPSMTKDGYTIKYNLLTPNQWELIAPGGDRKFNEVNGYHITYDPTNGIGSLGDIITTGTINQ